MKFIIKHTKELFFVIAIMMFIIAVLKNNMFWIVLGCANIVCGINYEGKDK